MRSPNVEEKSIASALCRSMNGRSKSPGRAALRATICPEGEARPRAVEGHRTCATSLVLFGQADWQRSELAPKRLQGRNCIRRRLHPFRAIAISVTATPWVNADNLRPSCPPQMAQEGAKGLGFDKARQRLNLIERDAGGSRRTRGGMDVRLLQAQAQRCERPCPCSLGERVRHGSPGEISLDILPERRWKLHPNGIRVGARRWSAP